MCGDIFTVIMNGPQSKMARAALGLSTKALADMAGVGINTVNRFESGAETLVSTVRKLQQALEDAGVIFIEPNGHGPGVRLRDK